MGAVNVHQLSGATERDAAVGAMLCSWEGLTGEKTPKIVVFLTRLLHEALEDLAQLMQVDSSFAKRVP